MNLRKSVNGIRIFEMFRKTPIRDNALTYVTTRDAAVAAAAGRKETSARVSRCFWRCGLISLFY